MGNTKAKNLIIIILIVLLLVCLGVVIWQYVKTENYKNKENIIDVVDRTPTEQETTNNQEKEDVKEDDSQKPNEEKKEENKTNEEKPNIDPYAKYKNYVWGTTKIEEKNFSALEIKNKKAYITFSEKTYQIKNISGTPKKAISIINGGALSFLILTQEGNVYIIDSMDTTARLHANMSKYNVIDLTSGNGKGIVYRNSYYLTSEGKLIDTKGKTYEEINKSFVGSFGSLVFMVYIDEAGYVYYSKNNDAKYIDIKDNEGKKIIAKELYTDNNSEDSETIMILTEDEQIVYIDTEGNVWQEKGKIKSYVTYNEDSQAMMIILMNNNKYVIKGSIGQYYYDVVKKDYKDIEETENAIESVKLYKIKENSDNEYYKNVMILSQEQIDQVRGFLGELEYRGNITTNPGNEMYKVIIKYKKGIELTIRTFTGSRVVCDGVLYFAQDQSIETFDSMANQFEWE